MPYTNNSELPKAVRGKLSDHQQTIFRNVFNSMMDEDGMTESRAFAGAWSKAKEAPVQKMEIQGQILKADNEQRMVWGWASVISEHGVPVVDTQGDVIKADTLMKAATEFMLSTRVTKEMHVGGKVGEFVHSLPLTKSIADSLGIKSDKEGWIVACKVYDDAVWEKVKSGELKAFSIGGRAKREKIK